jgi:hypothetical protein
MSELQPITIETILSVFKNTTEAKRLKEIKDAIKVALFPNVLILDPVIEDEINRKIEEVIKQDKNEDDNSYLIYANGKYKKRRTRRSPVDPIGDEVGTDYIGTAGECAVMSELLFRGYNANRMMVDDGVDIIAAKDNIYYYIQVKTTTIRNGKVYSRIGFGGFDRYINTQMRYIIVARYKEKDINRNIYFVFTSQDIDRLVHDRCISRGENGYNIKIKFNERNGNPIIYDEKETDISWNLNRFEL